MSDQRPADDELWRCIDDRFAEMKRTLDRMDETLARLVRLFERRRRARSRSSASSLRSRPVKPLRGCSTAFRPCG